MIKSPDTISRRSVRTERMSHAFTKYHLRGFPFDGVIHKFTEPDQGDPHDHPFGFNTFIVKGSYIERRWDISTGAFHDTHRLRGESFFIKASTVHQIISLPEGECWTFILPEQWERKPGFYKFIDGQMLHRFWDEKKFSVRQL